MSTPENTFIQSVHRHLPVGLYKMKNHNQYIGGIADCWYSGHKGDLWIEYKFIVVPSRANTMIDLVNGKNPIISHLQQEWLKSRYGEGRRVGVIVGCKEGGVWFRGTSWDKPYPLRYFMTKIVERTALAAMIELCCSTPG